MIEIDVAIVGGGFSGCAVAANLSRRTGSDWAVTLFEPSELGRGAAYGTRHREHLLNTRAKQMSLYTHDPDDFVRWLGPRGGPNDFVSRRTYGAYVADIARRAFERPRFTYVHDRVCAVRRSPDGGFVVESESGLRMRARSVVLAVGNLPPNDDWLPRSVRLHPGYVADPWRFDYSVVGGRVLIVGAGLTALDVLVALQACGHRGGVDIVSRNGRFPTVHAEVAPYDVIPALDTQSARLLMRSFRRHVADAAQRGFDWRAVLDAVRPEGEAISGGGSHPPSSGASSDTSAANGSATVIARPAPSMTCAQPMPATAASTRMPAGSRGWIAVSQRLRSGTARPSSFTRIGS